MNFDYMKNAPDFAQLYTYCCEAEEFALSKPNISVTSARKAMEQYLIESVMKSQRNRGDKKHALVLDLDYFQYKKRNIINDAIRR